MAAEMMIPVRIQVGDGGLTEVGRVALDPEFAAIEGHVPRRVAEFLRGVADVMDGGE
ncbi:hypothetical protein [Streptomyces sp. NBC_01198]|uniref:hypothetical protein n=1 Tax=Streptomyces sp. NBC_01198 TaxID=2903769 RepID=UPI002E0DAB9F|nr:hypothetical protein OG702_31900 [Streptomyces sp. NBC_01198]